MKGKIWMNNLIGAVFAFLLSVSAVGNLVTGYNLEVASMMGLFLWCACCALISALLFRFKYGGTVLLCLTVLVAPVIWRGGMLWDQLQSLCYTISKHYHDIYDWPILGKPITDEVNLPLMVLAAWGSVSVNWSVCRRKHVFIALPPVILPLVICLITTDRVPDEIYLYFFMLGIAMLLVTDWTRQKNPAQGVRLTFHLVIPIAAAFALLFLLNPQGKYINNAGKYQKEAVSWFQKLLNTTEYISGGGLFESAVGEKLNLRNVGPKSKISYAVMRVNSSIDGTIYLRGRDYDIYSGTGWESSLNRKESFTSGSASEGKLTIATYSVRDILYVPYYSTGEINLVNGVLDNDENLQKYNYYLSRSASGSSPVPDSSYTELPLNTRQWASSLNVIIDTHTSSQSEKIRRIESYVQNAASYDISTSRMHSDYSDFAQWFLEESDTGYCVHFATAATVLLRAAGIPARYVEGYMITCKAYEDVIVSRLDAHAWAEYYDFASGTWRILEATPADLQDEEEKDKTIGTIPEGTEPDKHPEDATKSPPANVQTQPTGEYDISDNAPGPTINKKPLKLSNWIKTVFWIIILVTLIPIQSHIRIGWKRKLWNKGESNERLITRWRQTKKMARLINSPFPEEMDLLAQKANFSQHKIQAEELKLFEDYREDLLETVHSKPWHQRFLLRWIHAIGR